MKNQHKAGVILSYTSEAIKILSSLLYTPIMLRLLGRSEYGLYQLVYSFVAYLGLLSFGFTASYIRFYSIYKKNDDKEQISRLNGMFLTIFCVIATIAIICGAVMILNIHAIFGTKLTESEYGTAKILMTLMVFNLAISFPNSVFTCITSAHEQFFFQRLLVVLNNLLNPFLSLPLLLMGYGSIGMVAVTTVITISKFSVNIWFVLVKLKERFIFNNFDFSLLGNIWKFTFFIFLNQIIDQVNWSVDKFLLGRMMGTTAVAIYGLGGQINTMYVTFSSSISSVFVPRVNKLVVESNDDHKISLLFTRIGRIQFMVLSLIMTGFIFFGKPFMRIWGGEGFEDSYYVALWLIIPVTVPLIQNLGIEVQRAKNKHQARSIVYFLIAIGNVFLSIPLIRYLGPVGAAIGTAVSLFLGNGLFMNWYYANRIGIEIKNFWKSIFTFVPAFIAPVAFGIVIKNFIQIKGIVRLLVWAVLYGTVYFVSMWILGMNDSEKKLITNMFGKLKESFAQRDKEQPSK
ncbi:MAG: oligosaccharide flippase family protein [Butyrivibrio sp.]|nr:oligosaccharide flippase family protein [Butyrivibrio sp.]